jgi:hypothetical protein
VREFIKEKRRRKCFRLGGEQEGAVGRKRWLFVCSILRKEWVYGIGKESPVLKLKEDEATDSLN